MIVAPWLAWNLATFSTIVQVSGEATPWMLQETGRAQRGASLLVSYSQLFFQNYGVAYSYSSFQMIVVSRPSSPFIWLATRNNEVRR
ncbi:MAG: hypothetical protein WKH64_05420 [Chloroflexia bacterium]